MGMLDGDPFQRDLAARFGIPMAIVMGCKRHGANRATRAWTDYYRIYSR